MQERKKPLTPAEQEVEKKERQDQGLPAPKYEEVKSDEVKDFEIEKFRVGQNVESLKKGSALNYINLQTSTFILDEQVRREDLNLPNKRILFENRPIGNEIKFSQQSNLEFDAKFNLDEVEREIANVSAQLDIYTGIIQYELGISDFVLKVTEKLYKIGKVLLNQDDDFTPGHILNTIVILYKLCLQRYSILKDILQGTSQGLNIDVATLGRDQNSLKEVLNFIELKINIVEENMENTLDDLEDQEISTNIYLGFKDGISLWLICLRKIYHRYGKHWMR
eukprot:TRINITY_DN10432_c0_g1_i1.p1 TRINITY_DN10432_c0_g1~~TRINITY_DN10432_c0_g1_i1.p1  ORF type:complete len:279 (-),score=62.54 TRINITY_DN10432_c0_g1_i1:189-1025(-)